MSADPPVGTPGTSVIQDGNEWWKRHGSFVSYPELQQGSLPYCVYAAIAGAVNHLGKQPVWTPQTLHEACRQSGVTVPSFAVADIALRRFGGRLRKHHHHVRTASERLSGDLIRKWIKAGCVVILSMELEQEGVTNED